MSVDADDTVATDASSGRPATVVPAVAEAAVKALLLWIGEDPDREGLAATPARVARAWRELTTGYEADVASILATTFGDTCDEMVVLAGIRFASTCEHHLLPFIGTATVGYVPGQRVVGVSKLARLVDAYARRLQIQERMTQQIAAALEQHLEPRGVGVVIQAHHQCMGCRGVLQPDAVMRTSALSGFMRDDHAARAEFLALG